MQPALYEQFSRLQFSHWWFLSRQRFLDVLLRRIPQAGRLLDLGCGTGSTLQYFARYGEVTGLDRYRPALAMAREHFSGPLVQGDCCLLPFADGAFTMVSLCEVLYHRNIEDVTAVLAETVRVLAPGGHLLVVDSAYSACFSDHDRAAHGARRFTRPELEKLLVASGVEILHATYAYAALLPVVWLLRRLKSLLSKGEKPAAELEETWPFLNRLLIGWFALEAQVSGRIGLPFGLSVQLLARKPVC